MSGPGDNPRTKRRLAERRYQRSRQSSVPLSTLPKPAAQLAAIVAAYSRGVPLDTVCYALRRMEKPGEEQRG